MIIISVTTINNVAPEKRARIANSMEGELRRGKYSN